MKKTITLFMMILLNINLKSQTIVGQNLDINNINARIYSAGYLFGDSGRSQFEVPKGTGQGTIFEGNIWIGGFDQSNILHLAAQTYRQSGADFFQGPIMNQQFYSQSQDSLWNKLWKINKSTIDSFKLGLFFIPPQNLIDWPANGDTAKGQLQKLAPYFDANNDGFYNPYDGDYPEIRGDQSVYFIYNDDRNIHTESGGNKIGVEIHGMAYAYECDDSAFFNTIFFHYDFINRANSNYQNMKIGVWTDFDNGCYLDDYIGTDTLLNAMYIYNGASQDAGCSGTNNYGMHPPAQSVSALNASISTTMFYDNSLTFYGNPVNETDYYGYLNSMWKNGSHLTYGGTGISTSAQTNFMYSGDPILNSGWTESTAGNSPSDRRGIASYESFNFLQGEVKPIDIAYVFARDFQGANITAVSILKQRIEQINIAFANGITPCGGVFSPTSIYDNQMDGDKIIVYPNPSTGKFRIKNLVAGDQLKIYNSLGEKIYQAKEIHSDIEFDLTKYSKGIYWLKVVNNNRSITKKIIFQ